MTKVTVSIVNWNTSQELQACIVTLLSQQDVYTEIVVVDNASTDDSLEMLRSRFPDIKVIANETNNGFGKAHNQAIKISDGDYHLILNPDTQLSEPFILKKMAEYMTANPDIGILGPKILNSDGSLQYSARRFPSMIAGMFRNTVLDKLFPKNRFVRDYLMTDWAHDQISNVDWLSGAALMVRKETIQQIGILDERFFMYCEDIDWCKRAHDAGWRVVYYPVATIIHRIGASSDKDPYRAIRLHHKSMLQYFLKYNCYKPSVLLTPLVMLGLLIRTRAMIRKLKQPDPNHQAVR